MVKRIFLLLGICFSLWSCEQEPKTVICMNTSLGKIRFCLYHETWLHRENMMKLVREGYYNGMLFHRVIQDFMIQTGDPHSKGAAPGVPLGEGSADYTLKAEFLPQFFHKKGVVAAAREGDQVNPERHSSGSHFYIVQGKTFTMEELDAAVKKINARRYDALYQRLKSQRSGEMARCDSLRDETNLARIEEELSKQTQQLFEKEKLVLTEEQVKAYTTVGGTPHLDGAYTVFGEVIEGMEVVERIAATQTDKRNRPKTDVVILNMRVED